MTENKHMHDHEAEYIMIPNEDGTESRFEILFTFENEETGKKYMFVSPVEEEAEDEEYQEVMAFRYTEENGELQLEMIDEENEEEWNMVEETFNTLVAEFYVDEEEEGAEA